jgi:hypothetical protein
MTGTNEVPGPGSDTLTGTAEIVIAPNAKSFCYSIVLNHGAQTTAAHIHLGDAGEAGPVVIPLVAPAPGSTTSAACMSASRAVLRDIERRPDDYYVNVHTQGHPAGALRGQLVPVRDGHHEHGD